MTIESYLAPFWGRKLRLDLHTHCRELTNFVEPTREVVGSIVARIKEAGLDGIAVTEHENKSYGFLIRDLVAQYFPGEVLIIPGNERNLPLFMHMVELYLSDDITFRFMAHPISPSLWADYIDRLHGLEIDNVGWTFDKERIREVARKHDLLLLSNSDAHYLEEIGCHYNEIELQQLFAEVTKRSGIEF